MIQDQVTVTTPPRKGNDSTFDLVDISGQVPDIDELLMELDASLGEAKRTLEGFESTARKGCGCW